MRRVTGLILAGLGLLLILAAILLPTWVSGQFIKFPLSENQTAVLQAGNASYFSAAGFKEQTGVTIAATYTIKGEPGKGNSSVAVWEQTSSVSDITNHRSIQQTTRTFAFDRRTGKLVDCCGANVNGNASIRQTGYSGVVFPFGTQKQTYQVFNTTLNRPLPFVYAGTATVGGIQTYEFVEDIPATQFTTQAVPGSMLGVKTPVVRAPLFDKEHVINYVDPETGALLNVNEHQTVTLRGPATGAQALVLYDADLIVTPASLSQVVALDSSGRNTITLIETTLPLVFGIVGGVALVGGLFLGFRRRKPHDDLAELDDLPPWRARAGTEPARDHRAGELVGVAPGLDDSQQELAAEAPEGDGPESLDPLPPATPAGQRSSRRAASSRRLATSSVVARLVTQATRFDSQTSPITRAIAMSSADGSPSCMALVNIATIWLATVFTSAAALGSANMKARVIASVSIGSRCMVRVTRDSTCIMRSVAVSPGTGLRSSFSCMRSNSSVSAATSRWILDGKYRYSVPSATSARSATARICTAS
jgi:Porin PorA